MNNAGRKGISIRRSLRTLEFALIRRQERDDTRWVEMAIRRNKISIFEAWCEMLG